MTQPQKANEQLIDFQTPRVFAPLLQPARYKGAHGGRGSGKSHFFAELLIDYAMQAAADGGGLRAVCIREVQKSLEQSVKRLIEDKIDQFGLGHLFNVYKTVIEPPGRDGLIIFQGMQNHTKDSVKSLEGYSVAWVEEAQSLSQGSLDLLRPTIRAPGSEIWFSWNPFSASDPIDAFLRSDNPPPRSVIVQANWRDNPWFPAELREEMEYDRRRDPDKYRHVWEGEYQTNSQARVFTNWSIEEFETPANARFYFGADWGYAVDPTVLVRCFVQGRKLYIDHEAYMVGCEIDHTPALFGGTDERQPQRWLNPKGWHGIPGATQWPIRADSARPETISYMKARGFNITGALKGAGSVMDGIEFMKSHDIVVHPRCKHTIDELTHYSWKVDPQTDEILPVLSDKKNHVIDAVRYALEGIRRAAQQPVFGTYGNAR